MPLHKSVWHCCRLDGGRFPAFQDNCDHCRTLASNVTEEVAAKPQIRMISSLLRLIRGLLGDEQLQMGLLGVVNANQTLLAHVQQVLSCVLTEL